jgi:hypothetical protein
MDDATRHRNSGIIHKRKGSELMIRGGGAGMSVSGDGDHQSMRLLETRTIQADPTYIFSGGTDEKKFVR